MPFNHGKFGSPKKPAPPKAKEPEAKTPSVEHKMARENPNEPKTVPHPVTGVHKVTAHHLGGGRFETHTHHDESGEPEKQQHESAEEMKGHVDEALPSDGQQAMDAEDGEHDDGDGDADDVTSTLGQSLGDFDS